MGYAREDFPTKILKTFAKVCVVNSRLQCRYVNIMCYVIYVNIPRIVLTCYINMLCLYFIYVMLICHISYVCICYVYMLHKLY